MFERECHVGHTEAPEDARLDLGACGASTPLVSATIGAAMSSSQFGSGSIDRLSLDVGSTLRIRPSYGVAALASGALGWVLILRAV